MLSTNSCCSSEPPPPRKKNPSDLDLHYMIEEEDVGGELFLRHMTDEEIKAVIAVERGRLVFSECFRLVVSHIDIRNQIFINLLNTFFHLLYLY